MSRFKFQVLLHFEFLKRPCAIWVWNAALKLHRARPTASRTWSFACSHEEKGIVQRQLHTLLFQRRKQNKNSASSITTLTVDPTYLHNGTLFKGTLGETLGILLTSHHPYDLNLHQGTEPQAPTYCAGRSRWAAPSRKLCPPWPGVTATSCRWYGAVSAGQPQPYATGALPIRWHQCVAAPISSSCTYLRVDRIPKTSAGFEEQRHHIGVVECISMIFQMRNMQQLDPTSTTLSDRASIQWQRFGMHLLHQIQCSQKLILLAELDMQPGKFDNPPLIRITCSLHNVIKNICHTLPYCTILSQWTIESF